MKRNTADGLFTKPSKAIINTYETQGKVAHQLPGKKVEKAIGQELYSC